MTTRTEVRHRGFFGTVFLILFWVFNAGMAGLMFSWIMDSGPWGGGTAIGVVGLLLFWVIGAVILGLCAMLTRGRKTTITVA